MKLAQIHIILDIQGPILTEASTMSEPGLDSPFARNCKGELYIPYSLVKGKLKEARTELQNESPGIPFNLDLVEWFGKPPNKKEDKSDRSPSPAKIPAAPVEPIQGEGSLDPERGRLHFTDFICAMDSSGKKKTTTGIKRDPKRKAAKDGDIQVSEKPFDAGSVAQFGGVCWFFAKDGFEVDEVMRDLGLLFSCLTNLGADRTVGFGVFKGAHVDEQRTSVKEVPVFKAERPPADLFDVTFNLLDPFLIAQKRLTEYLFEGSEIIPGGALKGTLASMVLEMLSVKGDKRRHALDKNLESPWGTLGGYFDKVRFTHAFPCAQELSRPHALPLSLVKFGKKGGYEDVALHESPDPNRPFLLGSDEKGQPCAPAFQIDWKNSADVKASFGWPTNLKRDLRVRHAHDYEKRRAEDEALFAYEMVVPEPDIAWRSGLDLSRVPHEKKALVWGCLKTLLDLGFFGIGKTKARSSPVSLTPRPEARSKRDAAGAQPEPAPTETRERYCCMDVDHGPVANRNDYFIVTLQTPAFLCDPEEAAKNSFDLTRHYKAVWGDLSKDSLGNPTLELPRFFARQTLEGGYLGKRYKKKFYNPFFLTAAGSVFVLKPIAGREKQASESLTKWRDHGLDLPSWVKKLHGNTWQENPFLPENGYGEIAVNLSCHWDKKAIAHSGATEVSNE